MRGQPPLRPGGLHTFAHALAVDVTLHLREGGLDLWEGPSRRRSGVHGRVEGAERDAAVVEFVDDGDEFAGVSAEAIVIEDDEDLALAQGIETGGEVRALSRDAGGVIFEDALAAGSFNASSWRSRTWRHSAVETRA